MTGFDLSTITGCYVGSTPATAIYLGATKIWPATQHDYSQDYLTIVSLEDDNDIYFKTSEATHVLSIEASTDGGSTWTSYQSSTAGTLLANLNNGNKLLIRGNNASYYDQNTNNRDWTQFGSSKTFNLEGNIMSLIYGDNFVNKKILYYSNESAFYKLFIRSNVISASKLILPATQITDSCYGYMFYGCSSLIDAPNLPATTLGFGCYEDMFHGCSSLLTAPELPATTLSVYCYHSMFYGCSSLLTAPELPATTLTTLCYAWMFYGCSSLNYIKCLATDISASGCLTVWVDGVAASGTFVKDANTTWPTGHDGIPSGWTVVDAA